jgi:hypothetical protein
MGWPSLPTLRRDVVGQAQDEQPPIGKKIAPRLEDAGVVLWGPSGKAHATSSGRTSNTSHTLNLLFGDMAGPWWAS